MRPGPIHSIYLTGSSNAPIELPPLIQGNIESLRFHHPGRDHKIYTDEFADCFIHDHFDKDVLNAYRMLRPLAYKADLLRYCALYQYGGVYADVSLHFFNPVDAPDGKMALFRDAFSEVPWIVSNSLIACQAGMPVFSHCIENILINVKDNHYGVNALSPTGPNLFGRAVAGTLSDTLVKCGDVVKLNRNAHGHSHAYIDWKGDVVAVSVKKGGGLSSLGASHSDDYNVLYNRKSIYGLEDVIAMRWDNSELANRGWSRLKQGQQCDIGIVAYGPYVTLPPGSYRARHSIKSPNSAGLCHAIRADVCYKSAASMIPHETSCSFSNNMLLLDTKFEITEAIADLEVRLFVSSPVVLTAVDLEITQLSGASRLDGKAPDARP